jgi:hypothetical protein
LFDIGANYLYRLIFLLRLFPRSTFFLFRCDLHLFPHCVFGSVTAASSPSSSPSSVWCSTVASSSVEHGAFLRFGHRRVVSFIVAFLSVVLGGGFIKRNLSVRELLVLEAEASLPPLRSVPSPIRSLFAQLPCVLKLAPVHGMPRCRPTVVGREERIPSAFI